ncbi:MAG: energy-coupling factor transporter ATPase [Firmicutes bacterium]|nr:energy-coupling factor transporter ATPase [Bacillota bacterium]
MTSSSDPIIRINDVTYEYVKEEEQTRVRALDGVTLDVEKGSFISITGKNGSGKSTLAKNINGLLVPTMGSITVKGLDTREDENIWDIRHTVGMVFQNPDNQIVSSIVEDDVAFGPENMGVPTEEIRGRVDEALKAVGMYDHRAKAPHLLSGGQKQRIAIAGVVAMKPECIVFDEPTALLDPKGRKDVMEIIHSLHKEGITVLLITHFMEEAIQADRMIVMDGGKIAIDRPPREIFHEQDKLEELDLAMPVSIELASGLRKAGIDIPKDVIGTEELVDSICQYR